MTDWLHEALDPAAKWSVESSATRIGLSFVAGFLVAGVYHFGLGRRREETSTLPTTLVLLTIVIALVTLIIGDNLARAFGLVGALSIVRFRTVVEDTRDTAFVIFAVVIGMGIGAGYAILAAIGLPVLLLAALLMRQYWPDVEGRPGPVTLTIRVGLGYDPGKLFENVFSPHLSEIKLVGTGTAKQGAALELTYKVRLRNEGGAYALVADLNRIEGVQGAEVK
jgi:predicted membrane protein